VALILLCTGRCGPGVPLAALGRAGTAYLIGTLGRLLDHPAVGDDAGLGPFYDGALHLLLSPATCLV
jgi:hypothetical protein